MKTLMILSLLMITVLCYSQKPKKLLYNHEIQKMEINPEWIEWNIQQDPNWLQTQPKRIQKQWIEYQKIDSIANASQETKQDFKTYNPIEYELKKYRTKMNVGYVFEASGLALFGTSLILEWRNINNLENSNLDAKYYEPKTIYTLKGIACGLAIVGIFIQMESLSNIKKIGIRLNANQHGVGIAIPITK